MTTKLAVIVVSLWLATPVWAHRLDEYLQATTISIEKDRISALIRLTPGVAVCPEILKTIYANADGVISGAEQQAYAQRVLGDLSLTVDGNRLPLRLVSFSFASIDDMKQGLGEIVLIVDATVPAGGSSRRLIFENHHQSRIGAYLANCLMPRGPSIRIIAQTRNYDQSFYQVDYMQADPAPTQPAPTSLSSAGIWLFLGANTAMLVGWLALRGQHRRNRQITTASPST